MNTLNRKTVYHLASLWSTADHQNNTTRGMSPRCKACGGRSNSRPLKQEPIRRILGVYPYAHGDRFLWMLEYKAEEEGKTFVRVPPRGTTQECSRCGATVHKTLRDRVHNCPYCGLVMDRDENAAKNILARGFEQLGLCQPDVKPVEVTA